MPQKISRSFAPSRLSAMLLAGLTFTLLLPEPSCACSCADASDQELFDRADQVFTARLAESDTGWFDSGDATHVFEVETVHKGEVSSTQDVTSATDSAACGLSVQPGETYIVFTSSSDGALTADSCSGTRPADEALDVKGAKDSEPEPGGPSNGFGVATVVLVTAVVVALLAAGTFLWKRRRAA